MRCIQYERPQGRTVADPQGKNRRFVSFAQWRHLPAFTTSSTDDQNQLGVYFLVETLSS